MVCVEPCGGVASHDIVDRNPYGGLRCPSEVLRFTWDDVDWERERITIHASKTEHHRGGRVRQIPVFPELRPYLDDVWE